MKFPKIIVLTINTHGGIYCIKDTTSDKNYIYPIITIPNGIKKLTIIDSVPFGININIENNDIEDYIRIIRENFYWNYTKIDKIPFLKINKIIDKTINYIKNKTINNSKNYKNIEKPFLRCLESKNIYKINKYSYDDKIVNKSFCYEIKDITHKFNKIQIINTEFSNIDLFDLLNKEKYFDGYETTLENILNFLSSKGVENILIFDFTCNSVSNNEISERTIRNFRREINEKLNNKRKYDLIL
jgi:hypothetical protein